MTSTRSVEVSRTSPSAWIIGSRFSRSLYVGRHRTARGIAVSSRDAQDVAPQRRARGPARPPRGPLGDPRGGVVQGHRVPACGGADQGVPLPIAELALDGKAKELPGIGKTIENKVVEVVEDGEMHALTKRRGLVPAGVVDFLRLPGVGPKTAARIWTQLGITSLDGLKTAAEAGRLRDLSGMGARSEEKILKALEAGVGDKAEERASPRDGASGGATRRRRARRRIRRRSRCRKREASGVAARPSATSISSRRRATRRRSSTRSAAATGCPRSSRAATRRRRSSAHDGLRFDLRVVPAECYGNVLQHFTGSKDHNIALREDAQRRGLSISEYGVTDVETGEVVTHASEDELYAYLGYRTHPARAARGNGRDRGRARRARFPLSSSSATSRARCTATRPGRPMRGARSRRWRSLRRRAAIGSSASPTTRTTCATAGSRRSGRRSTSSTGG